MPANRLIFFLAFLISCMSLKTGDQKVQGKFVAAEVDLQGKMYAIDGFGNLIKFSSGGDTLRKISVSNFGLDPLIDVSNPLEIVVVFPGNGKAVWFDNQLNQKNVQDIFLSGINLIAAAGRSNDGMLWVFDNNSKTLKKIAGDGKIVAESILLQQLNYTESIAHIYDIGSKIMMQDNEGNICEFDANLNLKSPKKSDNKIVFIAQDRLYFSSGKVLTSVTLPELISQKPDTVFIAQDSAEIVSMKPGFVLLEQREGLFLQTLRP